MHATIACMKQLEYALHIFLYKDRIIDSVLYRNMQSEKICIQAYFMWYDRFCFKVPQGKPKDLWKSLKSLGLPNNISSCDVSALKIDDMVEHDGNSVLEGFKNCCSTLAENLVNRLLKLPNKYSINTVI